jgi:hypothetical protein
MDRLAPNRLMEYAKNYSSPFPQNERYFAQLSSKIRWDDADKGIITFCETDVRRYRAIGNFLKSYELPEELTWQAILNIRPDPRKYGRLRTNLIRSCLLELANIFAEQQLMPDWNSYLNERQLERCLETAPEIFLKHLIDFEKWASNGMVNPKVGLSQLASQSLSNNPRTIRHTMRDVGEFLNWCVGHEVGSLAEISPALIAGYKETLFWKYECEGCHRCTPFESGKEITVCENQKCNAIGSYVKVRRLARTSVANALTHLRAFFNWAQLYDLVLENPLKNEPFVPPRGMFTVIGPKGEMIEIAGSIRRYDDSVFERLCGYIFSPEADPEEALVLYLIIFHLFTVTELRKAKIPSLVIAGLDQRPQIDRARDFAHLLLSPRKPTRGRLTTGRSGSTIKFPEKALTWLVPLLDRYFEQRRNVGSEYLLAAHVRVRRHNRAVSDRYVHRVVRRASLRVLNALVNVRDLRGTAAAVIAQRADGRGSVLTRLGYSSLSATRFNYLESFLLAPRPYTGGRL